MADKKLSQLPALTGAGTASGDLLYIVDVSEPIAADQSKKITLTEFQAAPVSAGTANGVLFLDGSKVPTTSTALTWNGTTLATTGALTVDGNTTLGNASTDTVQVNGYMGVGGAASTGVSVYARNTALTATSQVGFQSQLTATSNATTAVYGVYVVNSTEAASFNVGNSYGVRVANLSLGAGSSATNQHGLHIADLSAATNNYGITSLVSSGTNKWNIYASGTAANYFAGNVFLGDSTATTSPSSVGSFLTASSTTGAELVLKNSSGLTSAELVGGVAFGHDDPTTPGNPHYSGIKAISTDTSGTMTLHFYSGLGNYEASTPQLSLSNTQAVFNDPGEDYDFRVESDTSTHALFVQGSDGFVGVGTSSPSQRLDVRSGTESSAVAQFTGANSGRGLKISTALVNSVNDAGVILDAQQASGVLMLATGGSERLRIDSSGNVGIGTTNIVGETLGSLGKALSLALSSDINGNSTSAAITAGGKLISISGIAGPSSYTAATLGIHQPGSTEGVGDFRFSTGDGSGVLTERVRIDSSGNVGIGTSSPDYKLQVSGTTGQTFSIERVASSIGSSTSLGTIAGTGEIPTLTADGASIQFLGAGTWSSTSAPGRIVFNTTPAATTTPVERFQLAAGEAVFNDTGNDYDFRVESDTNTHALFVEGTNSNVKVGGSAERATTVGTNHLDIFNGTAPVGTLANGISLYSSSGEAYVMDAAGNATLFSPHDAETNEWIFKSKHTPSGKVLKIDVEKMLRFINDHFGLDAIHEFTEE